MPGKHTDCAAAGSSEAPSSTFGKIFASWAGGSPTDCTHLYNPQF
ncbi:MAG: hypothetical protein ACI81P_001130, partial [Neolewinella sp.]